MSAFGKALAAVLEHERRNKETIAQAADVAPSTVYRLVKGEVRPDHSTLPRIVRAATDNLALRYVLVIGHLSDEVAASGLPLSGLVLRRADGNEFSVPPSLAAEIALLVDCAQLDPVVDAAVRDLAYLAARALGRPAVARFPKADTVAERTEEPVSALEQAHRDHPDLAGYPPPVTVALAAQRRRRAAHGSPQPAPHSSPSGPTKAGKARG